MINNTTVSHSCFCTGQCKITGSCGGYTGTSTYGGNQRVGTCSLCGGDVYGQRGVWMSVMPPPPDRCSSCGAVSRYDVIPMFKPKTYPVVIESPMSDEFKRRIGIDTFE